MLDSKIKAPEFTAGLPWINVSRPLTVKGLSGKIVLLDFWTYCCSDCLHIMPYLKELEEKYKDYLLVIGVHSAKFDNEGKEANIKNAVARYGIEHPVVCDRGFSLWEKYYVREWPTLILIDPEGNVVERIACSQKPYGKFEEPIEALIAEYSAKGTLSSAPLEELAVHAETHSSLLRFPGKLAISEDGSRLAVADSGHNRVLICTLDGKVLETIGSGKAGDADGSFAEACFRAPQGLVFSGEDLYVADTENHLIRRVNLSDCRVETIAGNGKQRLYAGDEMKGSARDIALSSPWDLALSNSSLYIAMAGSHQIWHFDLLTKKLEIYAGTGKESLKDGEKDLAELSQTSALTVLNEKLYFLDSETSSLRVVDLVSKKLSTIVGEGLFSFGDQDGSGNEVRLQHPLGLASYKNMLLIADSYNHKIKIADPEAKSVRTISGTGKAGNSCGADAEYSEPGGLSSFANLLFIADTNNHCIKVMNLESPDDLKELELSPDKQSMPYLPNCSTVDMKEISLSDTGQFECKLKIKESCKYHLNPEMDICLYLDSEQNSMSFENAKELRISSQGDFKFKLFRQNAVPKKISMELALSLYYCADEGSSACFVKSYLFKIPCSFDGQNTKIELNLEL
ncbi:MAG: redoxin domain-containing protein [Candidatus Obscuribacterales bacterium]|nr:redoxin domain-containing protein [Candidatus Obscuribacterales bacterium]